MKRNRVHNFSAGPAQLPLEVLEEVRDELTNYKNIGSSIIEISHRDKTFVDLATESETQLRNFYISMTPMKLSLCKVEQLYSFH